MLDNINPTGFEKIRALAQKHSRSLEDEIKAIIEMVAEAEVVEFQTAKAQALAKVDSDRQRHAGKVFSDSVELLREDRNC